METYISEELIKGKPTKLIEEMSKEITTQISSINDNNYENVCDNMKLIAEILEILFEHIEDEYVELKYNPMGSWYFAEDEREEI